MAPIQSQQSYSLHSSSSIVRPFPCSCREALSDEWEWFLPITRRGHFLQDSFFENSRSPFDAAVSDVLRKWGDTSMWTETFHDTTDNFSRYRQLRSRNLKEENQAVTVSSDNNGLKIVLDVHDFMDGDIKVKVIGEKEMMVEGYLENKKEGECSVTSQKFSRRFLLPNDTNVEGITSVMSSDGILTITVPRKSCADTQEEARVILHKEASSDSVTQASKTTTQAAQDRVGLTSTCTETQAANNSEKYYGNCCKKLNSGKKIVEKSDQPAETRIPVHNYSALPKNDTESHDTSYSVPNQTEYDKKEKRDSCLSNQLNTKKSSENTTILSETTEKDGVSHNIPISVNFSSLPITRRGHFFNDSFFENSRNDFLSAVREVVSRWGERSSLMDDLTSYRNLRTRDLREENQAVKVKEDESSHKFIIDVQDFTNGGEVNVKAISDREIVAEGHIERQEGGAKSMKRFFKRFTVPGDIRLDSISSVMSSDGVLTITAPKKPSVTQIQDVTSTGTEEVKETSTEKSLESDVKNVKISHCSAQETSESFSELLNATAPSDVHRVSSTNLRNSTKEYIIPVNVEGVSTEVKLDSTSQVMNNSHDCRKLEEKVMTENSDSSATNFSSFGKKTESVSKQNLREIQITRNNAIANSSTENLKSGILSCSPSSRILPLIKRGSFSADSFFEDFHPKFQTAVTDVLMKFNESNHSDNLTAYRELRQRDLTFENQAFNVHEDEQSHKVVVDARDFIDGDITVSVVGEKELVIEGRTENKKDGSSSSLTFCRRVLLPDFVDMNSITSAISSDGVLTVESTKTNVSSSLNNVKKMSNEAHSKQESHDDSGHKCEEKSVNESSEQSEGYSSHTRSASYRSHQTYSTVSAF